MSTLEWNGDNAIRRLENAVDDGLTAAAMVAADAAERSIGRKHGGRSSTPGGPPNSQTGNLRNSIKFVSPRSAGTPGRAAVGTNVVYAKMIEFGGVARPTAAKAIPVPVNEAARRMSRGLAGASLRTKNLVVVKRDGKPPMLVEKTSTGKDKANGAVFVLQKSVRIAARPFLFPAVNNNKEAMRSAFVEAASVRLGGSG